MSLLRFVARSLFASYFIAEGVKAVTKPAEIAPDAERFTSTVTPLLQRVVPADVASYVPEKAETWVRVSGVAQIAGGAMYATGIGRRLGAKDAARPEILRNAALLGAAVLAAQDTEGRPSLSWRADHAAKVTEKKASALGADVSRSAQKAAERAEKRAKQLARKARKSAKSISRKIEATVN